MIIWVFLVSRIYYKQHTRGNYYLQSNNGFSLNVIPASVAIITFGYITFWAGMRNQFVDTAAYIRLFAELPDSWDSFMLELNESGSPGFLLFSYFFKQVFGDNYHNWLMAIAIISSIPIVAIFRKRSDNYFYSVILFMLSTNFMWLQNGIRQFIAVTILFGSCHFLEKKKPILWVATIILLSTVHNSVFIALPMYWFVTSKPFGKRMMLFTVGLMGIAAMIGPFMQASEEMFAGTAIEDKFEVIAEDNGANPLRVVVALVPVALAYINRKKIEQMNDSFMDICINMSMVSAGIFFIATLTSGIMVGRFPMYFELYGWILLPNLFERCYGRNKGLYYNLCTIGYLVWFYLMTRNIYYSSDITGFIQ